MNFKNKIPMKLFIQTAAFKQAFIAAIIVVLLLFTFNKITAQTITNKATFEEVPEFSIQQFSGTSINGKIYFKLLMHENAEEVDYVLESSADGEVFNEVAVKHGVKSPGEQALLYCYVVETNQLNDRIFRIKRLEGNEANYTKTLDFSQHTSSTLMVKK